jgi:hypothetical protein
MSSVTYTQDNLEVCPDRLKEVTVKSGTALSRGDLVKLTGLFSIAPAVAGTNTGNGTVGTISVLDNASVGSYKIVMLTNTDFAVYTPTGERLVDGVKAVAYAGSQIVFTVNSGTVAFVAGDSFTMAVTKATNPVVELFTTGSAPYSVMFDTIDATSGAKTGRAYREAELLASEVNFNTGTLAEVRDALDALDIHLV